MAKKQRTDAPPDPDKLVRHSAGSYRTADERFEARQADVGWFLVDSEQANEFGQELIHGPFGTLKALREAIPGARRSKVTPMRAPAGRAERGAATAGTARGGAATGGGARKRREPPPSWIDKLPAAEARALRRTIAALEREGIEDAELLVRRDRDGLLPAVAVRLIERRLAELTEGASAETRQLVQRVAEILSAEGRAGEALPGWALVEIGAGEGPPDNRRIDLRR